MLGLKVAIGNAQQVKQYLVQHELFDKRFAIARLPDAIVFPVTREFTPPFDFDVEFLHMEADERQQAQSLRDAMRPLLTPEEQAAFIGSYDIVGTIAIIEIPEELEHKEQLIAQQVLNVNKTIKTVLKKLGGHEGEYRTQQMGFLAGDDTRETTVVENGVKLRVNVETTYYSIRMATERKRIAGLVKPGERILCLFSGVGPYPVIFSVKTEAKDIVGIEINPKAHELAQENAAKNRCLNVRLFCGDAHEIIPKLAEADEKFDRVTMPLPHTAHEFIEDLFPVLSQSAVIHFYTFLPDGAFNQAIPLVRQVAARHGYALRSWDVIKAGQHAPRVWRICMDAHVAKEQQTLE
jgi:tRNA (guanine37-N1)-methyltransferase